MTARIVPIRPQSAPASLAQKQKGKRQKMASKLQETYRICDWFLKKHPEHEEQLDAFLNGFPFSDSPVKVSDIIDSVMQSLPENVFAICATRYRLTSRISNHLKLRVAKEELLFEEAGKQAGTYRLNPDWGKAKTKKPRLKTSDSSLDPRYATKQDLNRVETKVNHIETKVDQIEAKIDKLLAKSV